MPLNVPGLLAPFQVLFRPHLVVPALTVKDLRCLDFHALHRAGYRGAVFDKDNCLTLPYEDVLVPQLRDAWDECLKVFGRENVLVVSNSAGTRLDPAAIQAESVSFHLGVPVLRHDTMKPGYACIKAIRAYFASLPNPVSDNALVIVGDRVFTDVILANRMRPYDRLANGRKFLDSVQTTKTVEGNDGPCAKRELEGPLSIFVEHVWKKDATAMRYLEKKVVDLVKHWNGAEDDEALRKLFVRS